MTKSNQKFWFYSKSSIKCLSSLTSPLFGVLLVSATHFPFPFWCQEIEWPSGSFLPINSFSFFIKPLNPFAQLDPLWDDKMPILPVKFSEEKWNRKCPVSCCQDHLSSVSLPQAGLIPQETYKGLVLNVSFLELHIDFSWVPWTQLFIYKIPLCMYIFCTSSLVVYLLKNNEGNLPIILSTKIG